MSPAELISRLYLSIIILELVVILVLLANRYIEYRKAKWKTPVLWGRDASIFLALAFPFVAIAIRRAFNVEIVDEVWWIVITSTPVTVAFAYWIYRELKLGK